MREAEDKSNPTQKAAADIQDSMSRHGNSEAIDDYISGQPAEVQPVLQQLRKVIREAAPDSIEKISWQMPTFWQGENLIHFAAHKNHLGLYPGGEATTAFAERLAEYKTSKGAIQIPFSKPIPYDLVAEITRWRVETVSKGEIAANARLYEYDAIIQPSDKGGAYVAFPYDVHEEFGKGRVKVRATFDGEPYDGSLVNMGVKSPDGSVCYIIGIRKDIRGKIGKQIGDEIKVTIRERA